MKVFLHFFILLLLISADTAIAQPGFRLPQNKVWPLITRKGLDFNNGEPVPFASRHDGFEASASVSDAEGRLQFYTDGNFVWDRAHQLMPNGSHIVYPSAGSDGVGTYSTSQGAIIVPRMGSKSQYYVFSLEDYNNSRGGLFYSIVDMNLNNGMGDIVTGQKGVLLDAGLTEKMTAIGGNNCNVWLIVKPRGVNAWKAYEITESGINTTPVVSNVGLLSQGMGDYYLTGMIRFSTDGKKMAAGTRYNNVEIYDFDISTGVLSNPLLIATPGYMSQCYSVCFSPDNTRLYVGGWIGYLRQYDLTQPTSAAIDASEVVLAPFTNSHSGKGIGQLKLGPDGKIYFPSYGRDSLNVVQFPNRLGMACQFDSLAIPSGSRTGFRVGMPNDLAFPIPDTVYSSKTMCLWNKDSLLLEANDTSGLSYQWHDSSRLKKSFVVREPGEYFVAYSENTLAPCFWYIDTFKVVYPPVPSLGYAGSCPDLKQGAAWAFQAEGDTTTFRYSWQDQTGKVLRVSQSSTGDSISELNPGDYILHIQPQLGGCDTSFAFTIKAFPAPDPSFTVENSTICLGDTIVLKNTSGDPFESWRWNLGDGNASMAFSPRHLYGEAGDYEVTLVMETEKCADSTTAVVSIKDFHLSLSANKEVFEPGEDIYLKTSADEIYSIYTWTPESLFPDQSALQQTLTADHSKTIRVWGKSSYGCIDSAEVKITVDTKLFMPSAFSPNGDGQNDYFKPFHTGDAFIIESFQIYDRWGKLVWTATGNAAQQGWDGTYGGQNKAESGTYFYLIKMKTANRKSVIFKGDVTLLR